MMAKWYSGTLGPKVSWHLSCRGGKPPKKTSPRKLVPTGNRTRARYVTGAWYHLSHSGVLFSFVSFPFGFSFFLILLIYLLIIYLLHIYYLFFLLPYFFLFYSYFSFFLFTYLSLTYFSLSFVFFLFLISFLLITLFLWFFFHSLSSFFPSFHSFLPSFFHSLFLPFFFLSFRPSFLPSSFPSFLPFFFPHCYLPSPDVGPIPPRTYSLNASGTNACSETQTVYQNIRNIHKGLTYLKSVVSKFVRTIAKDNTEHNTDNGYTSNPRIGIKIPDPAGNRTQFADNGLYYFSRLENCIAFITEF